VEGEEQLEKKKENVAEKKEKRGTSLHARSQRRAPRAKVRKNE